MLTHLFVPPRPPARVVILGANGFVPRALHARLERDAIPTLTLGSVELDLLDAGSVTKLTASLRADDVLVFTAALTPEKGRDLGTFMKNMRMAEHVIAALAARPCAHVLYFSSDAVYDPRVEDVNETSPTAPADLYGAMHLARELALRQAAAAVKIPFGVLRPCAIYGSGDTHNGYGPNRFTRSALAEKKIKLFGGGEEIRDHVFIDDVVAFTTQAIAHRSTGTINLVSGEPVSFAEVASQISRLTGGAVAVENQPRANAIVHRRFDPAALRRAFPAVKPTPLSEGLARAVGELRAASSR